MRLTKKSPQRRKFPLISYQVSLILLDQVHLVHQAEDLCVRRVLQDGFQTRLVVMHIFLQLSALHVKHIDQHLYIAKDVVSLTRKVVFHESVLSVQFTCKDEAGMKSSSQKPPNKTVSYRGARLTHRSPTGSAPDCPEIAHESAPHQLR